MRTKDTKKHRQKIPGGAVCLSFFDFFQKVSNCSCLQDIEQCFLRIFAFCLIM